MVARVLAMKSATGPYELNELTDKEKLAEGVGFEPTRLSPAGFQDRCTRPLCEPSVGEVTGRKRDLKNRRSFKQEDRGVFR